MSPGPEECQVKIIEVGGFFGTVEVPQGSTVATALTKAHVNADAKQIKVNNVDKSKEDMVENGDTIYVVPNIKGAC